MQYTSNKKSYYYELDIIQTVGYRKHEDTGTTSTIAPIPPTLPTRTADTRQRRRHNKNKDLTGSYAHTHGTKHDIIFHLFFKRSYSYQTAHFHDAMVLEVPADSMKAAMIQKISITNTSRPSSGRVIVK